MRDHYRRQHEIDVREQRQKKDAGYHPLSRRERYAKMAENNTPGKRERKRLAQQRREEAQITKENVSPADGYRGDGAYHISNPVHGTHQPSRVERGLGNFVEGSVKSGESGLIPGEEYPCNTFGRLIREEGYSLGKVVGKNGRSMCSGAHHSSMGLSWFCIHSYTKYFEKD